MDEDKTQPCPTCRKPNRLTEREAKIPGYVCDSCYAEMMYAASEGMAQDYGNSRRG
jgi:hypothetical protein